MMNKLEEKDHKYVKICLRCQEIIFRRNDRQVCDKCGSKLLKLKRCKSRLVKTRVHSSSRYMFRAEGDNFMYEMDGYKYNQ